MLCSDMHSNPLRCLYEQLSVRGIRDDQAQLEPSLNASTETLAILLTT